MATFIRLVRGESLTEATVDAQSDLARGYSYAAYLGFPTEAAALASDAVVYHGVDPETLAQHEDGSWGFRLAGLCGFEVDLDPESGYASVEAAVADGITRRYEESGGYTFIALFEGEYLAAADQGDGDVFRPTALLSVAAL